jgi:hypothetical protein
MQAIPLLAWAVAGLPKHRGHAAVVAAACAWTAATVLLMQLALANQGLI